MSVPLSKSACFASLPPPCPGDLAADIRRGLETHHQTLVVLDDDPTGTQTVYDVPVLTEWDVATLRREFARNLRCFYLLTNSRSLPAPATRVLHQEIARNLQAAADKRPFTVVSRSDSTLRGHYPLETDTLAEVLGPFNATILIPYFEAGGRYTIGDVHYVAEGDTLVPAADTPFAQDAAFGYRNSNLKQYVEEKSNGRICAEAVQSFSLEELRTGADPARLTRGVADKLLGLPQGSVAIVNACHPRDLECFVLGLLAAEQAGARFLFRTAAQFVAARLGLESRPLLTAAQLHLPTAGGGLTVVGSYVPKSTEQLNRLLKVEGIRPLELSVPALLSRDQRAATIAQAVTRTNEALAQGRDVVVFTSRALVQGADAVGSLSIGQQVSAALVEVVRRLGARPRYLLAKGGITSSDVATQGLGVKRALVLGQILPGVPVWRLGDETRFPGRPYIVFPGNVGAPDAVARVVSALRNAPEACDTAGR